MSASRPLRALAGAGAVISCEHATQHVPAAHAPLFEHAPGLLETHRGWDAGAALLARRIARRLNAPLLLGRCSRLLVDLNRSERHPQVFSECSRGLPDEEKEQLLDRFHRAHKRAVCAALDEALRAAPCVVHLSVHSFTPRWKGRTRPTQLGLLDDPHRSRERALSLALRSALHAADSSLRVHLNRPYRGWTDGLVSQLRRRYPASRYVGLELEFNQARLDAGPAMVDALSDALAALRSDAQRAR